ncbi:DUF4129 domain-containing protein, partial [Micromonospora deserti]
MSLSRWWTETTAALGDHLPLPLVALLLVLAAALVAAAWYTFPAWAPRRLPRFAGPWLRWPRLRWPRLAGPSLRWPQLRWRRLRWPRLRWRRLRWRRRRRAPRPATTAVPAPREPDPELAPAAHASLADRLAAEGRYAESVRERLRAMIRELVARRVVQPRPGMTVVELVTAATSNRPQVGPPLGAAGAIFSELWYGQRPASAEHDHRMREHAADLHRVLAGRPEDGPASVSYTHL